MLIEKPTLAVYELYKSSIPSIFRNSLPFPFQYLSL